MIFRLRDAKALDWHEWFAWYPVSFEFGGMRYFVWLTGIERNYFVSHGWRYRNPR